MNYFLNDSQQSTTQKKNQNIFFGNYSVNIFEQILWSLELDNINIVVVVLFYRSIWSNNVQKDLHYYLSIGNNNSRKKFSNDMGLEYKLINYIISRNAYKFC
jgi:hypothetical protein